MKKTIFAALAALTLCSCGTIKIEADYNSKDGTRNIYTTDYHIFNDIDIALGARISDRKDTVLAIIVTYNGRSDHGMLDYNAKMQFRLRDNSEITLLNIYDREYEKKNETYTTQDRVAQYGYAYAYDPYSGGLYLSPYEVSTFIPRVHTRVSTRSYGLYLITKPQLMDIISKKVIKFRVEIENDDLDLNSGAEKVSDVLAAQFSCLKEGYSRQKQHKSF